MTFSVTGLPHYQSASLPETEMVSTTASGIETISISDEEVVPGCHFCTGGCGLVKSENIHKKSIMINFNFHFSVAGMHYLFATKPGLWTCHDLQRDRPTPLPVRIRWKQ